jgi:hypothetical protein
VIREKLADTTHPPQDGMPRLLFSLLLATVPLTVGAAPPDFDKQIAPLLASRCLDCHRGDKAKGDLDLSKKEVVLDKSGPVVPGKPGESDLWEVVAADKMPPKKPLSPAEKKLLRDWIESGAKWGADPIDPFRYTSASRAGYDWWALQPLQRPAVPAIQNPKFRIQNPIDAFVLAKLGDRDLSPSPPAGKHVLLRRVTFDLTGLPPTPEEMAAFLEDDSVNAYEKAVDRLLASPHYGERWGRHWLDVVRYGETDGFERNERRLNSWPYRDWVVRAFNDDMPYDQFAKLQLAGDVLRPSDPEAVKATGFLVAAVHNTVLGNDQMRAVARQDELEDLVGAVGQTFLGLTVNCARCHDHKFDPIAQKDFYRLASALSGVGHGERALPNAKLAAEIGAKDVELRALAKDLGAIEDPIRRAILGERTKGQAAPPAPIAAWDFRNGPDDLVGKMHAKAHGPVKFSAAGAHLNGVNGFLRTSPIAIDVRSKTLEAWVTLAGLTQRGGGVISLQTPDGNEFDAIVFAENEPGTWMAGSNGFVRTKPFGGKIETEADTQSVHLAISYFADGTITGFRNGKLHGKPYLSKGPLLYKAGSAVVVFGCRHEPAGGNKMLAGTVAAARLYDRALSAEEVAASFAAGPQFVADAEIEAKLAPERRQARASLKEKQTALTLELSKLKGRGGDVVYANVSQNPGVTRFLNRGQVELPGDVVAPGGLPALAGTDFNFGLPPDAPENERRRRLAEWVVSPGNPLFARVIVNRLWHHHFGMGLVETPSDFGFNGGRPSHAELLDWLAAELAKPTDGRPWALKRLHKLIVTSSTYRQSSLPRKEALAIDADNRLLWRMKPRRLEGEAVRDAMLAASGLLDRAVGGKGFSDYKERNFNGTAYYEPFDPEIPEAQRRSIYRFTPRGSNTGLLDTFDCPDPAAATPRRAVTTTPLQALSLWNGGFALRVSAALADRVAKDAPNDVPKQVTRAWRLSFSREPSAAERALAEKLVAEHGLKALCRALFNANEFLVIE